MLQCRNQRRIAGKREEDEPMEIRHLRYFVRAAEFLHFTRAAESLSVSQPALSLHIKQLEEEIGAPLFDRTTTHRRRIQLTQAGKIFLVHAQAALRSIARGKQEVSDISGIVSGHVTFGANNIFVAKLTSETIPVFVAQYPNVGVALRMANQENLENAILADGIDLALSWLPSESRSIAAEPLFTDNLLLFVPEAHAFAKQKSVTPAELSDLPVALPTVSTNIRRTIDSELNRKGVGLNVKLEIDDTPARLRFVEAGSGVTLAPASSKDDRFRIVGVKISGLAMKLTGGLLTRRGHQLSGPAEALAQAVRKSFKR